MVILINQGWWIGYELQRTDSPALAIAELRRGFSFLSYAEFEMYTEPDMWEENEPKSNVVVGIRYESCWFNLSIAFIVQNRIMVCLYHGKVREGVQKRRNSTLKSVISLYHENCAKASEG